MKDGFYIAAYISIDKLGYIENIDIRHDQNISLWKKKDNNITLIHYWELERITGDKQHKTPFYDVNQTKEMFNTLLSEYNISLENIEGIWGIPELDTDNIYHSLDDYTDISYHSICHLFSCLLSDTDIFKKNKILALSVDGAPDNVVDHRIEEKYYYCGGYSVNGDLLSVFPVYSPGVLWGYTRDYFNVREGTLMALATACTSQLKNYNLVDIWVENRDDVYSTLSELQTLFDYVENLNLEEDSDLFMNYDKRFTLEENKLSMIMKVIQNASNKIMDRNIENAIQKFNIDPSETILSISGGFALNCPSNSYLMSKHKFSSFHSIPCVNDSGLSLGIALYSFYKKQGKDMNFKLHFPFYGTIDNFEAIPSKFQCYVDSVENFNLNRIINDIVNHPIVWYQGRSEIGPRALGHRSIIADPRTINSKDILNNIKQREWWRPVAPIILEDYVSSWFENTFKSPYMLATFKLKKEFEKYVPSISHLDNTSRVQTLNEKENEVLYKILEKFNDIYKIPMLCNTSLNDKGEPIIDTIEETLNFALRKNVPIIYINSKRLKLKNHSMYKRQYPLERKIDFRNYLNNKEKEKIKKELNPHKVDKCLLRVYIQNQNIKSKINLQILEDVRLLEKLYKIQKNILYTI
ncbi:carbamoyltransferase C-terminal domain-containing protein [Staphylococcus agnetis]|uniref:carbamoyltransferase C-terminal domain-containing protein n=1 Tax=Staphylococcus agnetis TaxID=985762 RepID=UPI00143069D8|nr:carbamoyltransferase C-terminal domain-containing protein [Staphylococcus agnetis]